jgi:uncharacterized protein (DUF1778 family)
MPPKPKEKIVTIRFSDQEFDALQKAAQAVDITVSGFIREGALLCARRVPDMQEILLSRGGDNIVPSSNRLVVSKQEFDDLVERFNRLAEVAKEANLVADREIDQLKKRLKVLEEKERPNE